MNLRVLRVRIRSSGHYANFEPETLARLSILVKIDYKLLRPLQRVLYRPCEEYFLDLLRPFNPPKPLKILQRQAQELSSKRLLSN